MKKLNKVLLGLVAGASVLTSVACAEGMNHGMELSKGAQKVIANPKGTLQSRGITSLQDYVVEE